VGVMWWVILFVFVSAVVCVGAWVWVCTLRIAPCCCTPFTQLSCPVGCPQVLAAALGDALHAHHSAGCLGQRCGRRQTRLWGQGRFLSLSLSLPRSRSRFRSIFLSLFLSHPRARALFLSPLLLSLSPSVFLSLSPSLSASLSRSLASPYIKHVLVQSTRQSTHTLSLSLSHTTTHTHTQGRGHARGFHSVPYHLEGGQEQGLPIPVQPRYVLSL